MSRLLLDTRQKHVNQEVSETRVPRMSQLIHETQIEIANFKSGVTLEISMNHFRNVTRPIFVNLKKRET
jgi:hypothetical protein